MASDVNFEKCRRFLFHTPFSNSTFQVSVFASALRKIRARELLFKLFSVFGPDIVKKIIIDY